MPVLLASGGIDSTVLMYGLSKMPVFFGEDPNEEIINVVVDYGQLCFDGSVDNVAEHMLLLKNPRLRMMMPKVDIPLSKEVAEGPIFNPASEIPEGREPVDSDYINGRNTILVAQAAALASANSMALYLGLHVEDYGDTDRSPDFLSAFVDLQYSGGFKKESVTMIVAPFINAGMDKEAVIDLGYELGVDFDKTNSCTYRHPACGVCGICQSRPERLRKGKERYEARKAEKA